jgi:methyl-accepting chemotaxis protein
MATSQEYGREDFGQGRLNQQLDADALVEQIGLDSQEIEWRKDFIGFDQEDKHRLREYQDAFAANAEQVADDFYDNLTDYEQTVEVIGRSDKNVQALKRTQSAYLTTLADGRYGQEHFSDRARIGKIHDLLDMPMKHYLGQYGVYYDLILPIVGHRLTDALTERLTQNSQARNGDETTTESEPSAAPELREIIESEVSDHIEDILSILRIINLDMQVVTDTYIHSYSQQLEAEIDRSERLAQSVEDDLQQPITELESTAQEVSESANEITDAADQQSEQVDEIASEVSDLSATIEEVAATAGQVETASTRAESLAENGEDAATDAVETMGDIGTAVDGVAGDLTELQDRVDEIDTFVDEINGIADQTNILALNASIEAARAGKAGEGFGVVADEIKSLAQESQAYASDIEEMVSRIKTDTDETVDSLADATEQVDQGIERVQDAMENLNNIVEAVQETANGISEVADATDDQAAASEEIAAMVDQVVSQTSRVAGEIEELAAANEQQAAMANEVEESVSRLSGADSMADGGVVPAEQSGLDSDVTLPDDLPDRMPDFVVDMLSDEQLRQVARGELSPEDVM